MCTVNAFVIGLSTAIGASAEMSAQEAKIQEYRENQRIALENARMQKIQEQRIRQKGLYERGAVHSGAVSYVGQQKASLAGAGVVIGSGTAGQVIQNTRVMAERQRQMQLRNENIAIADNQRRVDAYTNQANAYGRRAANINPWERGLIAGAGAGLQAYQKTQPSSRPTWDDVYSTAHNLNAFLKVPGYTDYNNPVTQSGKYWKL